VEVPPGVIRPAMDRMRESLFSILSPFEGTSFLDLFAGSGIMAIEAISRGATRATLVERDRGKKKVIAANLALLEGTSCEHPRLIMGPVEVFIARNHDRFDTIYLDPPFDYRFKGDLIERIGARDMLEPDGRVVIHYPAGDDLPESTGNLVKSDERSYGRSTVRFYTASRSE
jgi:16S rRNA (guanine(966)-N(2))-methyltransferase RsmD